jgi:hypothetical protein
MRYCKKCKLLCSGEECEGCGNNKLCDPKENDTVYLITKDVIWSGAIEDILTKNDIPYLKQGLLGAGVTSKVGYAMENYQFFVPFGAYNKSKELLANIFID